MASAVCRVTLAVADTARARTFYGRLLGEPPPVDVTHDPVWPGARLTFGVDDVPAAVARVRAASCQATDPVDGTASCRDPLGLPFALAPRRPAPPTIRAVTLYVPDVTATRAFYAAALGVPFGEEVTVTAGRGRPGVIATYGVADAAAAADTVRTGGGTVAGADPALCTDDQGLSFYLTA